MSLATYPTIFYDFFELTKKKISCKVFSLPRSKSSLQRGNLRDFFPSVQLKNRWRRYWPSSQLENYEENPLNASGKRKRDR